MIKISSDKRVNQNDSTHDFTYRLSGRFSGTYSLVSANIPITFYTVGPQNDTIYFYENSTSKTATIANGYYTSSTIAAAIKSALDTASGGHNTYTVSYDGVTNKITYSAGNAFYFEFASNTTNSARKILGFAEEDTTSATSVEGTNQIDLTRTRYFNIVLSDNYAIEENSGGATFTIPVRDESGSIEYYEPTENSQQTVTLSSNYSRLHVELLDDDSRPLEIGGYEWSLMLRKI